MPVSRVYTSPMTAKPTLVSVESYRVSFVSFLRRALVANTTTDPWNIPLPIVGAYDIVPSTD